jgi:uncharacterized protein (DUF427 family)
MRRSPSRPEPITPGPGQESVWDYPRPPRVEQTEARIVVRLGGAVIADTRSALRVLETSHPPVYYVPASDFVAGALTPTGGSSMCEYKGQARYFDVRGGGRTATHAAWAYPTPWAGYATLVDHVAVYPTEMDSCEVDGERVVPQPGDFYGGWVTSRVVGPFKGAPGTLGW